MIKKLIDLLFAREARANNMQQNEKLKQRDLLISIAKDIVKKNWTNHEGVTEGMPGKRLDENYILKREANLIADCIKVIDSENPLLENRKYLANSVISCSELQVLVLTRDTDVSNLCDVKGISGELKNHLLKIVGANKKLKEFFYALPNEINFNFVWSNVLHQYRLSMSDMNIFSAMRVLFDDRNEVEGRDWVKPFFTAMCIYSEAQYRDEISLPNLFGERSTNIIPLSYSAFLNFVMNGEKFPNLTWQEAFPNLVYPNID